ncbi:hypothetical protein FRX31_033904 [Thalictrum thalictroides]|uniref:Uncharacterized protein n=1 Tax=Thalictrum thalictroides TaxID=46969 RepID=A0A7J6UVA3_THATH|nr:hypothetical protein FRX31_033904 [Thalictrum thalictroides]
MAHVKKVGVEDENKSKSLIEGVSSSAPKLPHATLPKFNTSSKKRPHSAMKLAPEPQFVTTSSNLKISSSPISKVVTKKQTGRETKGKQVAEVFSPGPFVYVGPNREEVSVMKDDSAFIDPMVARAVNEGIVLEADAIVVQKQSLFEMCSHMNSCMSVVSISNPFSKFESYITFSPNLKVACRLVKCELLRS